MTIWTTRFWLKVSLPNENDCMLWQGKPNAQGYGQFRMCEGKTVLAHRVSYEYFCGAIPDGLVIDHLCRVTACVAPLHLEAVTNRENVVRGVGPDLIREKTHCPKNHPYSGENLYEWKGRRECRQCRNERARERRARSR